MIRKRGCFVVLLGLFLIIVSFNVSSFGIDAGGLVVHLTGDCSSAKNDYLGYHGTPYFTCGWDSGDCDTDDWGYCDGIEGCDVLILQDGNGAADDCSQFRLKAGSIFPSVHGPYNPVSKVTGDISQEGNDDDTYCFDRYRYHMPGDYAAVCAYDEKAQRHYWTNCDTTVDSLSNPLQGILNFKDLEGKDYTYFCAQVNQGKEWLTQEQLLEKKDEDKDGVPVPWDCDDNDIAVYGKFGCKNKVDEKGKEIIDSLTGKPIEECLSTPTPICGDGKLNTCGVIADENDDCDSDKTACETNCLMKGGICSWVEDINHKNSCCGDDGINELGNTIDAKEGPMLCLNKAKYFSVIKKGRDGASLI